MTLADVVDSFPQLSVAAGATVEPEALAGVSLIVVHEGLVLVRTMVPGSTRRTITCHAGPGALVLPPADDEVLAALTDATLVTISTDARDRLTESPDAARLLVDGLAETLRQKHGAIASMSRLHHVDRVREKLIELAREHGRVGRDGIRLDFPLTHDLLGEMTGSARETVTRALDELQREGFVVRRGRTYSVQLEPGQLASS
ncbi:MAG: Crp/Fnr family transcriptional regulator [Actinobacteria bacterium]|nr:MAG: Crp/Fnr family transcriptional regulator [Actinomycetota bacterium]TML23180.1 MAG: Crp/Fnr family transcriptional regulator [Actinomycetota bacterium]